MAKKKGNAKKKQKNSQGEEQRKQKREVRKTMKNMGFARIPKIDGNEFVYQGRPSELDDIFIYENVVILCEYTIGKPGEHIKGKKIIYDRITSDVRAFFRFLISQRNFKSLNQYWESNVRPNYTVNQLQIRIVYVSKQEVSTEHKGLVQDIIFFDYPVVKYFESISKVIKKSCLQEFSDFLRIPYAKFGGNINKTTASTSDEFSGHILPEEHSSFKEGYKLVSFYIDANSLLKRAFVLRKDGWRNADNIGLYQRMFVGKKIRSMRNYLHTDKRVFINNLIVSLSIESVKLLDEKGKELRIDPQGTIINSDTKVQPTTIIIEDKPNIIGLIDGQHRLYAYHEGDDVYEASISKLRSIQNLLVTGILFPKAEAEEKKVKFQAGLFLEINSTQSSASTQLKQEIEYMRDPFAINSISKWILKELNESGPLAKFFEEYWFQKGKLKTTSIISFGLRHLVKMDGDDTLFKLWKHPKKMDLKNGAENYDALNSYKQFCLDELRKLLIAIRNHIGSERWKVDRSDSKAILSVTTLNGFINCLRLLIKNNKPLDEADYRAKLSKISSFRFNKYTSSQYVKLGEDIYTRFFA